ncbi:branched-chain amino acid transport system permease protein [Mesorhizobium robiniae]|uniref:Branched-chain amino acid transport system permease protein n=1 Tax=Mesorhizobium robiniae TaxID=559315 RepID=A0ABV2GXF2_9HYPH|nr:branched-chain amino acid ABC transporter permease [Mesorhizobium sp. ZC-5]MCV3243388.1 branched-chain amino acid ABC transporter permease [Mesorhizobium sp. ZC-5]
MTAYLVAILIFAVIYGFVALGLNIQWGLTGLINLGQVAFFAVGAYCAALTTQAGLPLLPALVLAALVSGSLGGAVALFTPRLREDYLAIVTLGFSEFVRLIFLNEKWLAGGPDGIAGIPRPVTIPGLDSETSFLVIAAVLLAVAFWFSQRLAHFPIGRTLRAIREDETVVASIGKPTLTYKTLAFVLGAALAGIGGALFASYLTYISPDMFGPNISIYVLAAVLLGRQGSTLGTLAGTAVVAVLLEGTRLLKDYITVVDGVQLAALRLMALGLALMIIVAVRYGPGRRA